MFKRLLLLASILLVAGAPCFASVGIFDHTDDVGTQIGGYGTTTLTWGIGGDSYEILASGHDIWNNSDNFHFAYNEVSGDVRFELTGAFDIAPEYWSKIEAMIRVDATGPSVFYGTGTRRGDTNTEPAALVIDDWVGLQARSTTGGGAWGGTEWNGQYPDKIAVQRVHNSGFQFVQNLVDFGSGWELLDTRMVSLPDEILAGAAVTSHHRQGLARAVVSNVAYTQDPDWFDPGFLQAGDPLAEACSDTPGFKVWGAKMPVGWPWWDEDGVDVGHDQRWWHYELGEYLARNGGFTGYWAGDDTDYSGESSGTAIVDLVNLGDWGGRRAFTEPDYPDVPFPGVEDTWTDIDDDTDDDNNFGIYVEACIELTEGIHVLGGAFDDGVLIRVGGVEIGRTAGWNDTSQWIFTVPETGVYSLEAVGFEIGGGAFMELYEYLPDGTMILLGDVASGGSAVFVPEPATIALLGFGGLSMLRIRRKR